MTKINCGKCGIVAEKTQKFCQSCGSSLIAVDRSATLADGNSWVRGDGQFAVRISPADLKATLNKGISIEEGTIGLFFQSGKMVGSLTPGYHRVESLTQRLKNLVLKRPYFILLIDQAVCGASVLVQELTTSDDQIVEASIELAFSLADPSKFFSQYAKGRQSISVSQLAQLFERPIASVIRPIARECLGADLYGNNELEERIEIEVQHRLTPVLNRMGLSVEGLNFIEFASPGNSAVRQQKSEFSHDVAMSEIIEKRKNFEVELERGVFQRDQGRQLNQMEFDTFVNDLELRVFKKKIMRQQERDELFSAYTSHKEDREANRGHLLATLKYQRDLELANHKHDTSVDHIQKQAELGKLQRTEANQIDNEQQQHKDQLAMAELVAELDRLELQRKKEMEFASQDFEIVSGQKVSEAQMEAQFAVAKAESDISIKRLSDAANAENLERLLQLYKEKKAFKQEQESKRSNDEHLREMERLQTINGLSSDALIATANTDQAKLLADIQKLDKAKGLSMEQILAISPSENPEVAKAVAEAVAEKFRAEGNASAANAVRESYDRILAEKDASTSTLVSSQEKQMAMFSELMQTALQTQRDTSVAASGGKISDSRDRKNEANQKVTQGSKAQIICPSCGDKTGEGAKFCVHCGMAFKYASKD